MNPKPNVRTGPGSAPQRRGREGTAPARKQKPSEERDILDEERGEDVIELEDEDEEEDEETD